MSRPSTTSVDVLLVEADVAVRRLTELFLNDSGFTCVAAKSPEHAWAVFLEDPQRFDLLITNVLMRDGNGLTLANSCQTANKKLRVIYTSSESNNDLSTQADIQVPAASFLRKPFNQQELLSKIVAVITTE